MRKKKFLKLKIKKLLFAIASLVPILALIIYLPPNFTIPLYGIDLSAFIIFFPLISLAVFGIANLFLDIIQSILVAVFISIYLCLRLFGFTNLLFLIILIGILITLIMFFSKKI